MFKGAKTPRELIDLVMAENTAKGGYPRSVWAS